MPDTSLPARRLPGRSLFSPLVKSLVAEREEGLSAAQSGREALILAIDRRLRFLAADSRDTLRGRWPPYRQVLLMVRDKLGIRCSTRCGPGKGPPLAAGALRVARPARIRPDPFLLSHALCQVAPACRSQATAVQQKRHLRRHFTIVL